MTERHSILIINPGSTSTKIALYHGTEEICTENFSHTPEEISACKSWLDQVPFRANALRKFLSDNNIKKEDIDLIVPRYITGSVTRYPDHFTANEQLIDYIRSGANFFHIMSITPMIPYEVFGLDIPMAVCTNDRYFHIDPMLTLTGIPEIRRSVTKCHAENILAVCSKLAGKLKKPLSELSIIAAHMGGGVSFAWMDRGLIRYTMFDGEACFTPERAGAIPALPLINMCYSGEFTKEQMMKKMAGKGGLAAYFGTNNALEISNRAQAGDKEARLVFDAMLARAAACIGETAALAKGRVDGIILTGGMAKGKDVTDGIADYVSYIAPVTVYPGEFEMETFAQFGNNVLDGKISVPPFDAEKVSML